MAETVIVPARFNGPPANGNGGYSAGIAAAMLEGPVEATLRRPVPLDRPLGASVNGSAVAAPRRRGPDRRGEGGARFRDRGAGSRSGRPRRARRWPATAGSIRGRSARCFVCGLAREDSFGVFSGRVEGRDVVASTWTPPSWTAGEDGRVRPEFVWAALDCPTFFGAYLDVEELPISFLGRITARIESTPMAGEEHVVMSWPLGIDGRKAEAGVSLLSGGGEVLASARAMLIEAKGE